MKITEAKKQELNMSKSIANAMQVVLNQIEDIPVQNVSASKQLLDQVQKGSYKIVYDTKPQDFNQIKTTYQMLSKMILYVMGKLDIKFDTHPDILILKTVINFFVLSNNFEAMYQMAKIKNKTVLNTKNKTLIHRIKVLTQRELEKNSQIFSTDIEYMVHSYNTHIKFENKLYSLS